MYCPKCRSEYREGYMECDDCGVALVDELPPKVPSSPEPKLLTATLLALIATAYMFLSRTMGTFVPELFRNATITQGNILLSIAASALILYFFIVFLREYVPEEKEPLRTGALLATGAVVLMLLLQLKGLAFFGGEGARVDLAHPGIFEAVIPLTSSLLLLIFFGVFYTEIRSLGKSALRTSLFLAIIGFSIGAFLRIAVFFHYLFTDQLIWLSGAFSVMPYLFLPLTCFMYFTIVYFFAVFYRAQRRTA